MFDINGIDHLGIDHVLRRGSGEIIADMENALLVRDSVSGAYMLACEDMILGLSLIDRHCSDCSLLMASNHALGLAAFERYGFSGKLECYQVAYYGEKPSLSSPLTFRAAEIDDLDMLKANYDLLSAEELEQLVKRRSILLGYYHSRLVGFIGEHLEGSMGILYVFPEYRRRGFACALQSHLIASKMDRGFIPFGQVEKDNAGSLRLQNKLGMTISDRLIVWMWK
ncbi:MAG: GNAT family N-acetyltransferase [Clostridiales bacterium]|nr:GNAT family N-acetyltransferase [Clostridiales bacterium]